MKAVGGGVGGLILLIIVVLLGGDPGAVLNTNTASFEGTPLSAEEEQELAKKSEKAEKVIEDRLLNAYKRIRENANNGLAVVRVERDSCGGCFNNIPPQRQMDISTHKKIIVCEHCGRILVDEVIHNQVVGDIK